MSYYSITKDHACSNLPMGFYRPPTEHKHLNYNERPENTVIDTIVIHYTVLNYADSYRALAHADGGRPGPSVHYMINTDGRIDNLVDDAYVAWHAGLSSWNGKESVNKNSIGIELVNPGSGTECCFKLTHEECPQDFNYTAECIRNPFPDAQIASLISLITCLKAEHSAVINNNIIAHADVAPARKLDTGIMFPWKTLCDNGIGICSSKSNSDAPINALYRFEDENEALFNVKIGLQKLGYGYIDNSTNIFDKSLAYVVRAFHFHHNQKIEDTPYWGDWTTLDDSILCDLLGTCSPENVVEKVEL